MGKDLMLVLLRKKKKKSRDYGGFKRYGTVQAGIYTFYGGQ